MSEVVKAVRADVSIKNYWLTLVLAVLFGILGAHRFYVGKWKTGILWFFTGGMILIGWILDVIKICCQKFTDKQHCYLKY